MDIHLRINGRHQLSRQIYEQLRKAIVEGRLLHDARLPSSRDLARRLDVSRNTAAVAYEWLAAQGLVRGRAGAGTFVNAEAPISGQPKRVPSAARVPILPVWSRIPRDFGQVPSGDFDFRPGVPDGRLFPHDVWRGLMAAQFRPKKMSARYGATAGHDALREAIAEHLAVARGVRASLDEVVITHGTQHGLDLVARVLVPPGARVAVEEPGYPPARLLFEAIGAEVTGVAVDEEGICVATLPDDARVVYVTPSHQYPLGTLMSDARRLSLLQWAERRNAMVIEDDYDSEFRFGGRPLDALQAADRRGRVIYIGSFSKTMLPRIRLGFVVAPPALAEALRTALFVTSLHCQWPAQGALAEFMQAGLFTRHIRRMRRTYAARHEQIVDTLNRRFCPWLRPLPALTGMHVCALLGAPLSVEDRIAREAQAAGIGLHRLSGYFAFHAPRPGLLLGYGGIATDRIDEGLRRLHRVVERACAQTAC